jgi:hypothetical protein
MDRFNIIKRRCHAVGKYLSFWIASKMHAGKIRTEK